MKKITVFSFLLSYLFMSFYSHANLLISPTRVHFEDRQRVTKVIVVNNSDEYKTYRLEWQEKIANPGGGYSAFAEGALNPSSLASMVRLSPSQVRLAPGERQIVKIALRKPKDLAKGEYRSHLLFKALPNEEEAEQKGFGIRLNMILSYSIPVILREKPQEPTVNINAITSILKDQKQSLQLKLERMGEFSSFGKIEVFLTEPGSSSERKIAMLNDYSIYAEVTKTSVTLPLFDGEKLPKQGSLRVVYSGLNEYRNVVFDETEVNFSASGLGVLK